MGNYFPGESGSSNHCGHSGLFSFSPLPQLTLARHLFLLLLVMGGFPLQPHKVKSKGQVLELVGAAAAVTLSWKPWCNFWECCDERWINSSNITGLDRTFRQNLYGQHIAHETVVAAIDGHLSSPNPPKPLVLSFHGRTGTGKNFVSGLIVESIYRKGMKSKYVHLKIADRDYRHASKFAEYKESLHNEVYSSVKECPHQLFIFDEVENMPAGLLDAIRPFLEYRTHVDGVSFNKAIFIFLSNTASHDITSFTLGYLQEGKKREDITLQQVESLVERSSFNSDGSGFSHSRLIDKYLVSHFIPFLPLETSQVRSCIRVEIRKHGIILPVDVEDLVEEVIRELQFWPKGVEIFATKGCKSVVEKLNLALFRYHRKRTAKPHGQLKREL